MAEIRVVRVSVELEIETTYPTDEEIARHAVSILQSADPRAIAEKCRVVDVD